MSFIFGFWRFAYGLIRLMLVLSPMTILQSLSMFLGSLFPFPNQCFFLFFVAGYGEGFLSVFFSFPVGSFGLFMACRCGARWWNFCSGLGWSFLWSGPVVGRFFLWMVLGVIFSLCSLFGPFLVSVLAIKGGVSFGAAFCSDLVLRSIFGKFPPKSPFEYWDECAFSIFFSLGVFLRGPLWVPAARLIIFCVSRMTFHFLVLFSLPFPPSMLFYTPSYIHDGRGVMC